MDSFSSVMEYYMDEFIVYGTTMWSLHYDTVTLGEPLRAGILGSTSLTSPKGESKVYSIEQQRIDYAGERLAGIKSAKTEELRKKFFMDADQRGPKSYGEVLDALTSGKFTVKEMPNDYRSFGAIDSAGNIRDAGVFEYLDFRDPAAPKPDKEGFKAAEILLNAQFKKTADSITFATDPAKQEAAVQAFETFSIN